MVDARDAAVHVEREDQRRIVGAQPRAPRVVGARHVLVDERDGGLKGLPQKGVDVLRRPVLVIQRGDLPDDVLELLPDRTEIGADRLPLHVPPVAFLPDATPHPVAALPDEVGEPPVDVVRRHRRRGRVLARRAGPPRLRPPALLDGRYAVGTPFRLPRPPLFLAQLVELPVDSFRQRGVENRRPRQAHEATQRSGAEQKERHAELEPPEAGKARTGHHETDPGRQPPAVLK